MTTPQTGPQPGPLDGIKVIDLSTIVFGPLAAQMLGDLGAEVIKVESPAGDPQRNVLPARSPGMGTNFLSVNRNKKSVVLDLKSPGGRADFLTLIKGADIFITNIRPAALDRLSLSPQVLRDANPDLITASGVGFGSDGPYSGKPAYDDIVQSVAGMVGLGLMFDPDSEPLYAPTLIGDKVSGIMMSNAIMAALFHRERTGQAQHIEVPMFETLVAFLMVEHMGAAAFEDVPQDFGYKRLLQPYRRPMKTADGYVTILPNTKAQWQRFFQAVGRPDMADHPWVTDDGERSLNIGGLYDIVAGIAPEKTTAEWVKQMEAADIPAIPVRNLRDLPQDPHLVATGFFEQIDHPTEGKVWTTKPPIKFSQTPARNDRVPVPGLGEHNPDILNRPKPD